MKKPIFEGYLSPVCEVTEISVEQGFIGSLGGSTPTPGGMSWDDVL